MTDAEDRYKQIIYMMRPVSEKHKPMPITNRAAQFAPFAALTGYDDLIENSARYTDLRRELSPEQMSELDEKLSFLLSHSEVTAAFTVFVKDKRKEGGEYVTLTGSLLRCDTMTGCITLRSGERFLSSDLYDITFDV